MFHYMYTLYYMKFHVPSMLAIGIETINKHVHVHVHTCAILSPTMNFMFPLGSTD